MTRILVNDHQWAAIKPHCMGRKGPNQTEEDVRRFIDAVVWIGRNGAPWRELPPRFGKWNTVFKRFRRWVKDGVFQFIFNALDVDIDRECVMIDATIFPVHQSGQGARGGTASQAIGHSRGGVTTKMLGLVDALGSLFKFCLVPGQANDILAAPDLLKGLRADALPGDRAFDADWIRMEMKELEVDVVIPPKSSRIAPMEYDKEMYKWRHLIENFFQKIKMFRGIAMRFCKTDESFEAFICLAAVLIHLR